MDEATRVDNHETFKKLLKSSRTGVYIVAGWLCSLGVYEKITIPKTRIAPDYKQKKDFTDDGDIIVSRNGNNLRVEVKHVSAIFTSVSDWPFKDFIVCGKTDYDDAKQKPYVYVILSGDGTHVAIVKANTINSWEVSKRKVSTFKELEKEFYFCPFDLIDFKRI